MQIVCNSASSAAATTAQLALVVAILVAIWNVLLTRLRWPRIDVIIRQSVTAPVGLEEDRAHDTIHIVVVNNGAEAASIATVGIRSLDSSRNFDVESKRYEGISDIGGENLPARVEEHGALMWTIPTHLVQEQFPRGTQIVAYTNRYKKVRIVPAWIKRRLWGSTRIKNDGMLWRWVWRLESPFRIYDTKKTIATIN